MRGHIHAAMVIMTERVVILTNWLYIFTNFQEMSNGGDLKWTCQFLMPPFLHGGI
jgi:hypothetical protein